MFDEIFAFTFGLIFGSLANLIILRFHTFEPLFFGGSKCLYCGKRLKWFELIPLFSFIVQKGRCRKCSTRLSFQYPAIEILTGVLFLFIWLKFENLSPYFFLSLFFWYLLFLASLYDLKHQILPDEFIFGGVFLAILGNFLFFRPGLLYSLAAGFSFFFFFVFLWFLTKKQGLGLGDAKMALALGIFLGFPKAVFGLIFSFWLGGAVGIALLALKKANLKTPIPFGPFLFLGSFIAFFLDLGKF